MGGVVFDYRGGKGDPHDAEEMFAFVQDLARSVVTTYVPIVERRWPEVFSDFERRWQLRRRAREAELLSHLRPSDWLGKTAIQAIPGSFLIVSDLVRIARSRVEIGVWLSGLDRISVRVKRESRASRLALTMPYL